MAQVELELGPNPDGAVSIYPTDCHPQTRHTAQRWCDSLAMEEREQRYSGRSLKPDQSTGSAHREVAGSRNQIAYRRPPAVTAFWGTNPWPDTTFLPYLWKTLVFV
jgi:hypothetical protein